MNGGRGQSTAKVTSIHIEQELAAGNELRIAYGAAIVGNEHQHVRDAVLLAAAGLGVNAQFRVRMDLRTYLQIRTGATATGQLTENVVGA